MPGIANAAREDWMQRELHALRTRLAIAEEERDRARGALAGCQGDLDKCRAELALLRPVEAAAQRLVELGGGWGGPWWIDNLGDYGLSCEHCSSGSAATPAGVPHISDCPAIALEVALAAYNQWLVQR